MCQKQVTWRGGKKRELVLKVIPEYEDESLIDVQTDTKLVPQPPTAFSFGRPGALSGAAGPHSITSDILSDRIIATAE
jgi:hypothetical protein